MKIQEHILIISLWIVSVVMFPVAGMAEEGLSDNFSFNYNRLYFQANPLGLYDNPGNTGGFLVVQVKDAIKMLNFEEVAESTADYPESLDFISFSYGGSSGLLGLSSGYISSRNSDEQGRVGEVGEQAGVHSYHKEIKNLYVGLDMNHSVALSDEVNLGMRAGVIYIEDIYSERDEDAVSVLFVMPVEINKSLTIEPRIHWTRNLTEQEPAEAEKKTVEETHAQEDNGSFYGGVSISLAY